MPLLLVIVPGIYIAVNSTTMLYESNPILYNLTFCLIGSKITNKLIVSSFFKPFFIQIGSILLIFQVAQMTKSELDTFDSVFLAPLILFVNQYLGTKFSESRLLWICLVR